MVDAAGGGGGALTGGRSRVQRRLRPYEPRCGRMVHRSWGVFTGGPDSTACQPVSLC